MCGAVLTLLRCPRQGATPAEDAAVCLFAGCDQLGRLREVDGMAGADRLLCLLNPQFKRLEDFSLWQRGEARSVVFERGYECSFAFEEFACRGEDVKLACGQGAGRGRQSGPASNGSCEE